MLPLTANDRLDSSWPSTTVWSLDLDLQACVPLASSRQLTAFSSSRQDQESEVAPRRTSRGTSAST